MVEILPEFRAWFLGMDETDFTPFADQVGKYAKERTLADIQVLYVGSPDPKVFFHICNAGYDFLEVRFVCDVLYHTNNCEIRPILPSRRENDVRVNLNILIFSMDL